MRIDNQRRSSNIRDRGGGRSGGGMRGGLPVSMGNLGIRGMIIVGLILAGIYFFAPPSIKNAVFGQLLGADGAQSAVSGGASTCDTHAEACDFVAAILGSTEDVWREQFQQGRLPDYGANLGAYEDPTLNIFSTQVSTACGTAPSSVGPFYCPGDRDVYIDPTFFDVMRTRLKSPGDFAQAYVIAHEVGHHIQNLIGATRLSLPGENQNQTSVRVELQADCLAGVWGHVERTDLDIDEADLREALNAAHSIGDDTLQRQSQGYVDPNKFSHGTSEQRMRWFRRGFDSGDARQCDTFAVLSYDQL